MYFGTFGEFLQMGQHGLYVWSAYGLAAVIFVWNVVAPIVQKRSFLRQQARRLRREQMSS